METVLKNKPKQTKKPKHTMAAKYNYCVSPLRNQENEVREEDPRAKLKVKGEVHKSPLSP